MNTPRCQLAVLLMCAAACAESSKPEASGDPVMKGGAGAPASGTDAREPDSASAGSGQPRASDAPATSPMVDASSGVRAPGPDAGSTTSTGSTTATPEVGSACEAKNFEVGGDPNQLAPGRRYCLEGSLYPGGYVSSNCQADADCAQGSRCDGENCRKPCEDSSSCRAPMVCADVDPFASCQCTACALGIRM